MRSGPELEQEMSSESQATLKLPALLLLPALTVPAQAQDKAKLEWKFEAGKALFQRMTTHTMQTGTRDKASVGKAVPRDFIDVQSMKLTDWQGEKATLAKEVLDVDKRRLHVDDNTAVLVQFNDEKMVFEYFRTRTVPYARKAELAVFHALVKGAYSDGFYNQFEAFCDGIIDLKAQEEGGRLEQYIRVRALRGKTFDSRWHRIRLSPDGEVVYSGISFGL